MMSAILDTKANFGSKDKSAVLDWISYLLRIQKLVKRRRGKVCTEKLLTDSYTVVDVPPCVSREGKIASLTE